MIYQQRFRLRSPSSKHPTPAITGMIQKNKSSGFLKDIVSTLEGCDNLRCFHHHEKVLCFICLRFLEKQSWCYVYRTVPTCRRWWAQGWSSRLGGSPGSPAGSWGGRTPRPHGWRLWQIPGETEEEEEEGVIWCHFKSNATRSSIVFLFFCRS